MQPPDFIFWALGIGLSWAIFVNFVPVDRWIGNLISRKRPSSNDLESRVAALEDALNKRQDTDSGRDT